MNKSYLQELLSEEVKNNPGLEKKLEKFLYQDKIDYIPSWIKLTTNTYKYLLDNGLDREIFLKHAILSNEQEVLDLALANKPDLSSIDYRDIIYISTNDAQKLIELGLPANILLRAALKIEQGERHDQLLDLALANKPDLSSISSYEITDISTNEAQKLIELGLPANILLSVALSIEQGERHDQLLDLALANKPDLNSITSYDIREISTNDAQKLIERGLPANILLHAALNIRQGERHDQLLDLALANKPDLSSISSYEITNISTNEAQKLIELDLPAHILLSVALSIEQGERHNQLLDLALANKPNFSKLFYLQESISESDLEAMINSGCSTTKILKLALRNNDTMKFVDYLITKGADLTKIYSLSSNLYFETYEDLLTKGLNPNALIDTIDSLLRKSLMDTILSSDTIVSLSGIDTIVSSLSGDKKNKENKQKVFDLTKLAIDNGADISNIELPITSDIELIEFFLNHGVKCASSLEEITENGLTDIIFNPQKTIEQKFKNLDALKSSEAKIPYLLHHIWLTSLDNPKEIRDQDLKIVLQTKETFAKADIKWEQTVWTNDKNLFPKTVKILEDNGIQVKSIYDYKDNIALFDIIEELIADQKWGMASDTLRYSLVNEFGGVYADLNFKFNRDTTDEAHKYNFFTQEYGGHYIDNFFFGASPHHPIMQEILKLVERNLVNPPEYISRIKDPDSSRITDMATANPTFIAYYGKANQNGNIDVVYPRNYNSDEYFKNTISISIEEAEKVYSQYCPDVLWEKNFYTHPSPFNNMCIAEKFIIGEDSKDGRTWINEG